MIHLDKIQKVYRTKTIETTALNMIDLHVPKGEFLSIPEIILADEPTGNLDSVMGDEVMDILIRLNKDNGTTIVMVTHDERMAKKTDRLVRLYDGSQVA